MSNSMTDKVRAVKGQDPETPSSSTALDAICEIVLDALQDEAAMMMVKALIQGAVKFFNNQPVMRLGELHFLSDAAKSLGANERTIARWEAAGLKPCRPGTSHKYVVSDDVMDVMRKDATEIPEYEARYKQKSKKTTRKKRE